MLGREGISAMDKAKQLGNWEAVQVMEKWEHGGKEGCASFPRQKEVEGRFWG